MIPVIPTSLSSDDTHRLALQALQKIQDQSQQLFLQVQSKIQTLSSRVDDVNSKFGQIEKQFQISSEQILNQKNSELNNSFVYDCPQHLPVDDGMWCQTPLIQEQNFDNKPQENSQYLDYQNQDIFKSSFEEEAVKNGFNNNFINRKSLEQQFQQINLDEQIQEVNENDSEQQSQSEILENQDNAEDRLISTYASEFSLVQLAKNVEDSEIQVAQQTQSNWQFSIQKNIKDDDQNLNLNEIPNLIISEENMVENSLENDLDCADLFNFFLGVQEESVLTNKQSKLPKPQTLNSVTGLFTSSDIVKLSQQQQQLQQQQFQSLGGQYVRLVARAPVSEVGEASSRVQSERLSQSQDLSYFTQDSRLSNNSLTRAEILRLRRDARRRNRKYGMGTQSPVTSLLRNVNVKHPQNQYSMQQQNQQQLKQQQLLLQQIRDKEGDIRSLTTQNRPASFSTKQSIDVSQSSIRRSNSLMGVDHQRKESVTQIVGQAVDYPAPREVKVQWQGQGQEQGQAEKIQNGNLQVKSDDYPEIQVCKE